jgi:hypothetical protein
LARRLGGLYVSIDAILDDHRIWESGRLAEFLRANQIAVVTARPALERNRPVVVDGNFYWKGQLDHLLARLPFPCWVFTLRAPVEVCIQRDRGRPVPHGELAARHVHAKTTRFESGTPIDATRPVTSVVREMARQLRTSRRRAGRAPSGTIRREDRRAGHRRS